MLRCRPGTVRPAKATLDAAPLEADYGFFNSKVSSEYFAQS
jgi:hypothetical protein